MIYCFVNIIQVKMRAVYELTIAPDFSLNKYSLLSETGPSGVITQHSSFWRYINRWGKQFKGIIRFIYYFDSRKQQGKKLSLLLIFEAQTEEAIVSVKNIMKASSLAPYYDKLELVSEESELSLFNQVFLWRANAFKKERFTSGSNNESDDFYSVSDWEMNVDARLYSLMKMMESMDEQCVYCVHIYPIEWEHQLKESLTPIIRHIREMNSINIKTSVNSISSSRRDENAKRIMDYYEDLEDKISDSPHFGVNIQTFGQSENAVRQLLDSASSEALRHGDNGLYVECYNNTLDFSFEKSFLCFGSKNSVESLMILPHLFTLDEIVPFVMFPVLYPGESIEMPKESDPHLEEGMYIGTNSQGYNIFFPWSDIAKHIFLSGMPGSGKTNAMKHFVSQMHNKGIKILVLEPAKTEYRALTISPGMEDVSFFSPSANSMFPIHINPFEFPVGMKLADHINRLLDVFNGSFQLDPPFPMLLAEGIQNIYEKLGWLSGFVNSGRLEYPTLGMLYSEIESLLDKYDYASEVKSNLTAVLQVRIGSLIKREMGDIFDVCSSTIKPEEWLETNVIMELASLGTVQSNFLTLMLMTLIREALDVKKYTPQIDKSPRHVIFLEEAHNLVANTVTQYGDTTDPKISATANIVKMLAEVRALGEGIVITDQLPSAMAPEIVKNTSLKIALRLTASDEREIMGTSISADNNQKEKMALFEKGRCLAGFEGLLRPFELQIPDCKNDIVLDNKRLLKEHIANKLYIANINRSAHIMYEKIRKNLEEIQKDTKNFQSLLEKMDKKKENEKKDEKQYSKLIDRWDRLLLETALYITNQGIRERLIKKIEIVEDENPMIEKRTVAIEAHAEIRELLFEGLYKMMKKEHDDFMTYYKDVSGNYDLVEEKESKRNRMLKQIYYEGEWI